ncbi:MAG: hypothetical protein NVS2B17_06900 [Candidatus Velthaea sp.]
MRRTVLVLLALLAIVASGMPASAQSTGAVKMNWKVSTLIASTMTPNYQTGFGPQGGGGSGSTPAAGPSAALGSGYVDFGNVIAGYNYIYKYAAQVAVTTNDTSGFKVYGEGSTNLNGATTGSYPISSILLWLISSSANSPFSPGTSFQATTFPATNGGMNINYGTSTPPATALIWSNSTAGTNVSQGYDYQLRLPSSIPIDSFSVYVVYTVIGN